MSRERGFKVRVMSVSESEAIQENLFHLGIGWMAAGKKIQHLQKKFLYIDLDDLHITHGQTEESFNDHKYIEVSI